MKRVKEFYIQLLNLIVRRESRQWKTGKQLFCLCVLEYAQEMFSHCTVHKYLYVKDECKAVSLLRSFELVCVSLLLWAVRP